VRAEERVQVSDRDTRRERERTIESARFSEEEGERLRAIYRMGGVMQVIRVDIILYIMCKYIVCFCDVNLFFLM